MKQSKDQLYEKIKIVKGDNFVTIEDTKNLSEHEFISLVTDFLNQPAIKNTRHVSILIASKFSDNADEFLLDNGFRLHDENVTVWMELDNLKSMEQVFTLKTLNELSESDFKDVWQQSMKGSLNAPSSLTMDEQLRSVEVELGPKYKDSCIVAYEEGKAIGVIMPHIEPGLKQEGRIFYFGLVPEVRGLEKSKYLHQQALWLLKNQFKATYYIGNTSHNNAPMLKTFQYNGCKVLERNKVYKRIIKD
ncbi:hypothetical protein [Virgibacillus siamensis]|uniref:hypothetical protein n=1 Tax=Virgibacillus siamensis TaxID=480071 RepID=UPI000984CEB4|nr:hypothetical protein [Virgibacillus siamensis]